MSERDRASGPFDPDAYWERRLQRFDLSSVGYRALGLPYNEWLYKVRSAVFRQTVNGLRDWNSAEVLDVGSGTGFYVGRWLDLGASVTGSDLTSTSVEKLRTAHASARFIQLDVGGVSALERASFDAVSAMDVLFHIVDDRRYEHALVNAAEALRPGGYFIFSDNFVHGRTVRLEHQVSRRLADVESLLIRAGLTVITRRPMFVLMNAPTDSRNRLLHAYWKALERVLDREPRIGSIVGAALYPLERLLVRMLREGPSTEIMVCRKPAR